MKRLLTVMWLDLMNYLKLKQAAGDLQIQDLEAIDRWLVDRPTPEQKIAAETES